MLLGGVERILASRLGVSDGTVDGETVDLTVVTAVGY
jgi:hypothetical protein